MAEDQSHTIEMLRNQIEELHHQLAALTAYVIATSPMQHGPSQRAKLDHLAGIIGSMSDTHARAGLDQIFEAIQMWQRLEKGD